MNYLTDVRVDRIGLPDLKRGYSEVMIDHNLLYYTAIGSTSGDFDSKDHWISICQIPLNYRRGEVKRIFTYEGLSQGIFLKQKSGLFFRLIKGFSMGSVDLFQIYQGTGSVKKFVDVDDGDFDFWNDKIILARTGQFITRNNLYLYQQQSEPVNISVNDNLFYRQVYIIGDLLYTNAMFRNDTIAGYSKLYKYNLLTQEQIPLSDYHVKDFIIDPTRERIYFSSVGLRASYEQEELSPTRLYSMSLYGGDPTIEINEEIYSYKLAGKKDGTDFHTIFYSVAQGKGLYKKDLATGQTKELLGSDYMVYDQFIAADGYIAAICYVEDPNDLHFKLLNYQGREIFSISKVSGYGGAGYTFDGHTAVVISKYGTFKIVLP